MELEQAPLLRGLSAKALARLERAANVRNYLGNEVIFGEGDPAKDLYVLRDGGVLLTCGLSGDRSTQVHVAQIDPGESFGWAALVGQNTTSVQARALDDSSAFVLAAREVQAILQESPEDGLEVMRRLAGEILSRLRKTRSDLRWLPRAPV